MIFLLRRSRQRVRSGAFPNVSLQRIPSTATQQLVLQSPLRWQRRRDSVADCLAALDAERFIPDLLRG